MQIELGQLQEAAALFQNALMDNPDDWTSLQQYLDCVLVPLIEAQDETNPPSAESQAGITNGMSHLDLQDRQQVSKAPTIHATVLNCKLELTALPDHASNSHHAWLILDYTSGMTEKTMKPIIMLCASKSHNTHASPTPDDITLLLYPTGIVQYGVLTKRTQDAELKCYSAGSI